MEIHTFAEQILFGTTLQDKFSTADHFSDRQPKTAFVTPKYPGRPHELAFSNRKQQPFPKVSLLDQANNRGLTLHYFANHELLALEIMALALLRFHDAPKDFRCSLVDTMIEEQKHLRLYMDRMSAANIALGDIAMNDFFWRILVDMPNPLAFCANMSLTLEQANLDYARYYKDAFTTIGDTKTAAVLEIVYREEVGHVKNGLAWFQRWRDPNLTEWQSYQKALMAPLTPRRAKGTTFDHDVRQHIGFSHDYISRLKHYSHSRGRGAQVYLFNPTCEIDLATQQTPTKAVKNFVSDFSAFPAIVAGEDDIVLVEKQPSSSFLDHLIDVGITLPQFVSVQTERTKVNAKALDNRLLTTFVPWGWTPKVANFMAPLHKQFRTIDTRYWEKPFHDALRSLYDKTSTQSILENFYDNLDPFFRQRLAPLEMVRHHHCRHITEVERAIVTLQTFNVTEVAVKAPFGAAGRRVKRINTTDIFPRHARWIQQIIDEQECVIVSAWLPRCIDYAVEFKCDHESHCKFQQFRRFFTSEQGQSRAHLVSSFNHGLPESMQRFLSADGKRPKWLNDLYTQLARLIAPAIEASHYQGPLALDALIYENKGDYRIHPLIEINPRYTMGCYTAALSRFIQRDARALWLHVRTTDTADGLASFARNALKQYPIIRCKTGQIESGIIFTNDPFQAQQSIGLVMIAINDEALREQLERLKLDNPFDSIHRNEE